MRIAIVDDLKTERALLKERLSQQLALRGVIVNLEHAADFRDAAFCMTDGSRVYVNQELLKPARQAFMEFLLQGERMR